MHKEVFALIRHALEKGSVSSSDREKIMNLWRDVLMGFWGMPFFWLFDHSVAAEAPGISPPRTTPVALGAEQSVVGRRVLTASGFGECVSYRASDATYEVKLSFGTSFVAATGVQLAPEAPDKPPAPATEEKEDGRKSPMPGVSTTADASSYPEPDEAGEALPETTQMLFGTQTLYVFLRLHEMLYQVSRGSWVMAGRGSHTKGRKHYCQQPTTSPPRSTTPHHSASARRRSWPRPAGGRGRSRSTQSNHW